MKAAPPSSHIPARREKEGFRATYFLKTVLPSAEPASLLPSASYKAPAPPNKKFGQNMFLSFFFLFFLYSRDTPSRGTGAAGNGAAREEDK